jgi:DNA-binding transcriptional MerR regulator
MKYGQVETEKLYFSSTEVAEQIGVSVSVLHSWEKEFPSLNPKKNANGKRIYKQSDIELAKEIKEKTPIAPVANTQPKKITNSQKSVNNNSNSNSVLLKIRNNLQSILKSIKKTNSNP